MFRRIYTVSYDPSSKSVNKYGKRGVPCIRFSGAWLMKKAGLKVGDKIQVLADTGKIAILKIYKGGDNDQNATNTEAATNRVGGDP